jgi:hypothetical protein
MVVPTAHGLAGGTPYLDGPVASRSPVPAPQATVDPDPVLPAGIPAGPRTSPRWSDLPANGVVGP